MGSFRTRNGPPREPRQVLAPFYQGGDKIYESGVNYPHITWTIKDGPRITPYNSVSQPRVPSTIVGGIERDGGQVPENPAPQKGTMVPAGLPLAFSGAASTRKCQIMGKLCRCVPKQSSRSGAVGAGSHL